MPESEKLYGIIDSMLDLGIRGAGVRIPVGLSLLDAKMAKAWMGMSDSRSRSIKIDRDLEPEQ